MKKGQRTYTPEQKIKAEQLGGKGFTDFEISKILGLDVHTVKPITTKYWKEKMKNKNIEPKTNIS